MDELAPQFEAHRSHLRAVAYRMLGSASDADDAVQEAWLRVSRADTSDVDNPRGWLTTVVARVCLNALRSRTTRREQPLDNIDPADNGVDPETDAVLADSVGLAMLVVLDQLAPAERVSLVLHDMFGVPFDEIAPIVHRTPAATRQLASRARKRVRQEGTEPAADLARQRELVAAFLAASRGGDFQALLAVLDPDVVLRADATAAAMGAEAEVRGAADVAATFSGRARAARLASIDGAAGLVWSQGGKPQVVFTFTVEDGRITAVELVADPARLSSLAIEE